MASSASENMKGYYRHRKGTVAGGINKSKTNSKGKSISQAAAAAAAAALGSDITQPTALMSHGAPDLKDDFDENENMLRQFDMNMRYGPCVGMGRLARWERAYNLGMNPPKEIEGLLRNKKAGLECLWDGRV